MVSKLTESRSKKLRHIQNTLIVRSRELDQRSVEIGSMNSMHLKLFETKAQEKLKLQESETSTILKNITSMLDDHSVDATTNVFDGHPPLVR